MLKSNWKSNALLTGISVIAGGLFFLALVGTVELQLFGTTGLVSLFILLMLTLAASRFTVSVTSTDGVGRSRKSVADTFVFLAVMLYATPAHAIGPGVLVAALVGFVSTYRLTSRRDVIFTTAMAVISTFVAASLYGALLDVLSEGAKLAADGTPSLDVLLVPLFTLAALQYSLTTVGTAWFESIDAGKFRLIPSRDTVVWTLTTQLAGAASAVLFYSAIRSNGISYALLGLLTNRPGTPALSLQRESIAGCQTRRSRAPSSRRGDG